MWFKGVLHCVPWTDTLSRRLQVSQIYTLSCLPCVIFTLPNPSTPSPGASQPRSLFERQAVKRGNAKLDCTNKTMQERTSEWVSRGIPHWNCPVGAITLAFISKEWNRQMECFYGIFVTKEWNRLMEYFSDRCVKVRQCGKNAESCEDGKWLQSTKRRGKR